MLNGLDLFSGIGGLTLALRPWVRPIAYCEKDRYCHAVLLSRMRQRQLPSAPIWDDITSLRPTVLPRHEGVDIIYGGFPCQDISCAGTREGLEGSRSRLFYELVRLTRDLRPRFVFLENVPAITVSGLERVLLEFTALGYDARWTLVSAAELGACHLRERWFMLAYSDSQRGRDKQINEPECFGETAVSDNSQDTTDADGARLERLRRQESKLNRPAPFNGWVSQPTVCRGVNGVRNRVDRIRGLGNAVVPAQAREAFMRLSGMII
jgi:DNA (cytosine-5)-methyltransferase 1